MRFAYFEASLQLMLVELAPKYFLRLGSSAYALLACKNLHACTPLLTIMGIMYNSLEKYRHFILNSSSRNLLPLPLVTRVDRIGGASKRLLDRRPWLRSDIEFRKLRSDLEDIHTRGVEDLFGRGNGYSEVRVFGETGDEEHEATGLDLHFGEVCTAGGDVRMPSIIVRVSA
jgi:hypothetical protein